MQAGTLFEEAIHHKFRAGITFLESMDRGSPTLDINVDHMNTEVDGHFHTLSVGPGH